MVGSSRGERTLPGRLYRGGVMLPSWPVQVAGGRGLEEEKYLVGAGGFQ